MKREQIIKEIFSTPSVLDKATIEGIIRWYDEKNFPLEELLKKCKETSDWAS